MNVRNCKMCGTLFNYVTGPSICPACREKTEAKFQEVKEYIRENKGATIPQIAEACDVEPSQIRQWLREDRLEVTEDSALYLNCESCGAPIRSGRFCDKCKNQSLNSLNSILDANKPKPEANPFKRDKEAPKMRFLDT